jgi:hypothetical protein
LVNIALLFNLHRCISLTMFRILFSTSILLTSGSLTPLEVYAFQFPSLHTAIQTSPSSSPRINSRPPQETPLKARNKNNTTNNHTRALHVLKLGTDNLLLHPFIHPSSQQASTEQNKTQPEKRMVRGIISYSAAILCYMCARVYVYIFTYNILYTTPSLSPFLSSTHSTHPHPHLYLHIKEKPLPPKMQSSVSQHQLSKAPEIVHHLVLYRTYSQRCSLVI